MSASQLLRILQTLPACANDEIRAFNTDELEASMNESPRYRNPFLSNEENDKANFWNSPELECSNFGNDFTNNHEDEKLRKSLAPCNVPSDLFEKAAGFYIEKNAIECELPELIVCYKESASHVVKDIGVDEGMPHDETILFDKDDHEVLCNSVPVKGDDDMIEVSLDTMFLNHECSRPSSVTDCCMYTELSSSARSDTVHNVIDNHGTDSLTHTGEEKLNSSANLQDGVSTDQPVSNSILSLQQDMSLASLTFPEPSNNGANDVDQQALQSSVEQISKRVLVGSEAEQLGRSGQTTNMLNERKMEGSVAFELPSSALNHQSVASGSITLANQVQRGERESSFSTAGLISGLITCSRPIPFSGSISTRSDSSTTSARSFAFPTLQTEWNSSPVRMAKAVQKRLQKHQGWRQGLLCCRF